MKNAPIKTNETKYNQGQPGPVVSLIYYQNKKQMKIKSEKNK